MTKPISPLVPSDTPAGETDTNVTEGALRVWWMPQVPCKSFILAAPDVRTAAIILSVLAFYDLFQFKNKIKPDYANMGGVERFEGGEWCEVDEDELLDALAAAATVEADHA